ncbi:MAG: T9SS type A sorting domain-containing protein [Bacteroidales bacterium]|nr:T9SS type A sorting domain-containing protein [Bacteroidales bacterium]MCF8402809.1 T9SS type A sorting domain-containing protein [Bacteroidales bacterium]
MKGFLFASILSIITLSSFSQDYHPLPESDTYWIHKSHDIPMICGCGGTCSVEQYIIAGDTLINELVYHKIVHSGYWLSNNCDENFFYNGYQGAFRNDIENKIVWFVPEGESSESLLYEFDLQVGDTLSEGILDPNDYWDFWVEDIDSVLVGDSYRKRFHIRSWLNMSEMALQIVEGVGGQNLIKPFESWYYFEGGYTLSCININDSIFYPEWGDCEMIVSQKENKQAGPHLIFPNPTNGLLWFQNSEETKQLITIEIFNQLGVNVKSIESKEEIILIDLSSKPKGLYFIKISTGFKTVTHKIIHH